MDKLQTKARARYAFAEFLGGIGKRCTPERLRILDAALEHRKPFRAEEIVEELREDLSLTISRATLFNTLPLLVQCGLLRRIAHDRAVTYEPIRSRSQMRPRQNLICTDCGKVHNQEARSLADWVEKQNFRDFIAEPSSAVVYVYGLCSRCRRKSLNNKPK